MTQTEKNSTTSMLRHPLIIFILGGILGAGISYLFMPHKRGRTVSSVPASTQSIGTPASKIDHFVNPVVSSAHYNSYSFTEIRSLQPKLETYIKQVKTKSDVHSVSVYYRDLTNDFYFGINENEVFSPASLLKVPVMIAVLKMAEERNDLLSTILHYSGRSEHEYTGVDASEVTGNTVLINDLDYSVDKLVEIMIVDSDNEATILLINLLEQIEPGFLEQVQKKLGLTIGEEVQINDDFISVKRYSSFFRTLYNASFLSEKMSEKALLILSRSGYGYGIRQAIPRKILVSHKFGDKEIDNEHFQLHHFAIVYHPRKPFLLGIMTKGHDADRLKNVIATLTDLVLQQTDLITAQADDYLERDLK